MSSEKYASYHTAETMNVKLVQSQIMAEQPIRELSFFVVPPDSSESYVQIDWAYSHFFNKFVKAVAQHKLNFYGTFNDPLAQKSRDGHSRLSERFDTFNLRADSIFTKKDDVSSEQQLDHIGSLAPESQLQQIHQFVINQIKSVQNEYRTIYKTHLFKRSDPISSHPPPATI